MKTLKLKTLLVVGLLSVWLVGCGVIEKEEIELCIKLCEPNGGIREMKKGGINVPVWCYCANGMETSIIPKTN